MPPPPQYLFRAYSDQSQGLNTPTLFAPKAALNQKEAVPPRLYTPKPQNQHTPYELIDALAWKTTSDKFLFFTPSLLLAISVATFRKSRGETGLRIACLETDEGEFESVPEIFRKWNHPGVKGREYADVYVSMRCVDLSQGRRQAWISAFSDLVEAGLYRLYPALEGNERRFRPRLNFVVQDMRRFGFGMEEDEEEEEGGEGVEMTMGMVGTAAEMARGFRLLSSEGGYEEDHVPVHILACLLSFRKRDSRDRGLRAWLGRYAELSDDDDNNNSHDDGYPNPLQLLPGQQKTSKGSHLATVPEVQQSHTLLTTLLHSYQIPTSSSTWPQMTRNEIASENKTWQEWRLRNKNERRAARGEDPERERGGKLRHDNKQQQRRRDRDRKEFRKQPYPYAKRNQERRRGSSPRGDGGVSSIRRGREKKKQQVFEKGGSWETAIELD